MPIAQSTEVVESPNSIETGESSKDKLSKAIDTYVDPLFQEYNAAEDNMIRAQALRDGPLDVALNGIFTNGTRRRANARFEKSEKSFKRASELKLALLKLSEDLNKPKTGMAALNRFNVAISTLRILFKLSGDSMADKKLRDAFKIFLNESKRN